MSENQLTEQQSLELITRMIHKAKSDYRGTGIGAFCCYTADNNFCSRKQKKKIQII
jgi:hypothetical protein